MPALLFLAALLSFTGEALATSVSEKIRAFAGQTVLLPCQIPVSDDFPTVEWSKEGLAQPNITFLYRDGCETHEMKNPVFQYRTHLIMSELNRGNISLRISNVQLSDAGKYRCMTLWRKTQPVVKTLELLVVAVSEPKLSVVSAECGEVTLQCEADRWQQEPEITFLDDQGNNISAENPKRHPDSRGFFTITRRATVQTTTNRVTCRVHQPEINQTRDMEIHIPVGDQKLSVSAKSHFTGSDPQLDQADDIRNANIEQQRRIDELKSNLHEKDETIHQLTEELNDLRSRQGAVVSQQNQPTIDNGLSKSSLDAPKPNNVPPDHSPKASKFSHDNNPKPVASTNSNHPKSCNLPQSNDQKPGLLRQSGNPAPGPLHQRSSHNNSSPALLTNNAAGSSSSSSASTSEENCLVRSMSMSESRSKSARPKRRYTTSGALYNRYTILENLPE
ncbi:selection and upkeep of intraepithelial T-cells protein 6-like isoform X2 [Thunnus albacares]|uniref:selection and upkeep of intraepithelial T-cells protein 6-like isoform X2 n=1 Tax=Thunnus albacares TaxID=8236 RepID=UPI001CF68A79|nr:selection and upkeep of intraepithelial T-cells protein 6-like isoform X2 [Thunnus albacares]